MRNPMRGEFDLPELIFGGLAVKPDGRTLVLVSTDDLFDAVALTDGTILTSLAVKDAL